MNKKALSDEAIRIVREEGGRLKALKVVERMTLNGHDTEESASVVAHLVTDGLADISPDFEIVLPDTDAVTVKS